MQILIKHDFKLYIKIIEIKKIKFYYLINLIKGDDFYWDMIEKNMKL